MKGTILGLAIVVFLVSAVGAWSNQTGAVSQPETKISSTVFSQKDGLIAIDLAGNDQQDQIAVIDPKVRSLGIYQVDRKTGEIVLKSVRKIHWDLQLDEYNGSKPIVRDIRSTVERNLGR